MHQKGTVDLYNSSTFSHFLDKVTAGWLRKKTLHQYTGHYFLLSHHQHSLETGYWTTVGYAVVFLHIFPFILHLNSAFFSYIVAHVVLFGKSEHRL